VSAVRRDVLKNGAKGVENPGPGQYDVKPQTFRTEASAAGTYALLDVAAKKVGFGSGLARDSAGLLMRDPSCPFMNKETFTQDSELPKRAYNGLSHQLSSNLLSKYAPNPGKIQKPGALQKSMAVDSSVNDSLYAH
jgi:hypothetical protein